MSANDPKRTSVMSFINMERAPREGLSDYVFISTKVLGEAFSPTTFARSQFVKYCHNLCNIHPLN